MAKIFNNLLLETGDALLQENGDNLLLENYYYWEAMVITAGLYTYTGFGVNFIKGRIMKVILLATVKAFPQQSETANAVPP